MVYDRIGIRRSVLHFICIVTVVDIGMVCTSRPCRVVMQYVQFSSEVSMLCFVLVGCVTDKEGRGYEGRKMRVWKQEGIEGVGRN